MLFDKYTDKAEMRDRAVKLYQITLCDLVSSLKTNKKNLLLLFLFGKHYAARYQIVRLLPYSNESYSRSIEFLETMCRRCQIKKYLTDDRNYYFDIFILDTKGLAEAKELFKKNVRSLLKQNDPYYALRIKEILADEPDNIDFLADVLERNSINAARGNKVRHLVATNDSFLSLLSNFPPACLPFSDDEVEFSVGMIRKKSPARTMNNRTDVRADAVHLLPTRLLGQAAVPDNDSVVPLCIEQDTMHQSTTVLTDKINRYAGLVGIPRLERYGIPLVLVFSILPFHRKGKDETRRVPYHWRNRTGVQPINELRSYASLLSFASGRSEGDITLSDLSSALKSITVGRGVSYYDKAIKVIDNLIRENSAADLPVSQLSKLEKPLPTDQNALLFKSSHPTYARRRTTIFDMLAGIDYIGELARLGFSIGTVCNYEPASVLSFFSAFFIEKLQIGDEFHRAMHVPFFRLDTGSGTEITFRNAFRSGDNVYFVENILEDYCGRVRLETLLLSHQLNGNLFFVAVVPFVEFAEAVAYLTNSVPDSQADHVLICSFDSYAARDFKFTKPQPFRRYCI